MGERHPTPEFVEAYREWLRAGPPKCCHTCDFYDRNGKCIEYGEAPEKEFAETVDACPKWTQELPF